MEVSVVGRIEQPLLILLQQIEATLELTGWGRAALDILTVARVLTDMIHRVKTSGPCRIVTDACRLHEMRGSVEQLRELLYLFW